MARSNSVVARRLDPAGRYGLRLTLFGVAVVLVAVPFGWLLKEVVGHGSLVGVDTSAANHLHHWVRHSHVSVRVLQGISWLGRPPFLALVIVLASIPLLRHHLVRLVVFLATTTLVGGLIDTAVKLAVSRPRPSLEDPVATAFGKSFPSGHAMTSTIAYGALLLVFLPVIASRWRGVAIAGVVLLLAAIGFSRLALGVHYISDVLGGYVLGAAWLSASTAAFSIWRVERGRPAVHPMDGIEPEAAAELHDEAKVGASR